MHHWGNISGGCFPDRATLPIAILITASAMLFAVFCPVNVFSHCRFPPSCPCARSSISAFSRLSPSMGIRSCSHSSSRRRSSASIGATPQFALAAFSMLRPKPSLHLLQLTNHFSDHIAAVSIFCQLQKLHQRHHAMLEVYTVALGKLLSPHVA